MGISPVILTQASQALRALDADLPFLASEAAIELDNLGSGESNDLDAVRRLAEKLKISVTRSAANHYPLDPATLVVLGEAVTVSEPQGQSSQTVDDLLVRAGEIAEFLSGDQLAADREKLNNARLFCVALSRSALAYRRSLRDLRPSHPFRR